jgi:hypothetical protein
MLLEFCPLSAEQLLPVPMIRILNERSMSENNTTAYNSSTLKMESGISSKKLLAIYRTTQRYIPDHNLAL